MSTFIHGIAASENIDSSGEIVSISGMDISTLEKDGVLNWEHKADQPGQVVGKIVKARKIFSEKDCEDEHQLYFFRKCGVPYLYIVGELMDDYKDSAREVAGQFRYDSDRKDQNKQNTCNFSIEGAKIPGAKEGMIITRSIARKVTLTVTPCNKSAIAELVPAEQKRKKNNIDELFKTETIEIEMLKDEGFSFGTLSASEIKKDQPKLTAVVNPNPLGSQLGVVGSHKVMSHAKPVHYAGATHQELKGISDVHFNAARNAKTPKAAQHHTNQSAWFRQASQRLETRQSPQPKKPTAPIQNTAAKPSTLHDPQMSGKISPPSIKKPMLNMNKALEAGSGMAAPSNLVGGAALAKEGTIKPQNVARPNKGYGAIIHKSDKKIEKSKWLARAEQEYSSWSKKDSFESFMSRRMPHLTKGEIRAIGQVMILNKSMTLEKALSHISGYEPLEKSGGKDSIYTLILFEGCDLHDILHCSHFATDAMDSDTYEKIKEVCDKYFNKDVEAKELEFKEVGELGKESQKVLFLTEGDPYKDLFDELDKAAPYKYSKFRPHISVTSNVNEFKGKAASLVISVNGEVKNRYDFKHEDKIPGGLADDKSPKDFDSEKLAAGVKVELEHTSDPSIAEEIAMDHLTEDPEYYEKLKLVEKK